MKTEIKVNKSSLILAIIFLWFGLLFSGLGFYFYSVEKEYEQSSAVAKGIVVKKHSSRGSKSTNYIVDYKFSASDQKERLGDGSISFSNWNELSEGGPIDIQYIAAQPDKNRPAQSPNYTICIGLLAGTIPYLLLSAFFIRKYLNKCKLFKELQVNGQATEATVVSVEQSKTGNKNTVRAYITFEFTDLNGIKHTGKSESMTADAASTWKQGDKGQIRYLAKEPSKNLWIGR